MKNKIILIAYLNNGNMASEVAKEIMFNRVLDEMIDEGREVKSSVLQPKSKSVKFNDGSKLMMFPFSTFTKDIRVTHVFADEALRYVPRGIDVIHEIITSSIMKGEFEKFDTSGKQFSFFSFNNGELHIN